MSEYSNENKAIDTDKAKRNQVKDTNNTEALESQALPVYAQVFAFLGNTYLSPMSQTSKVGLFPEFWDSFPAFGSDAVRQALEDLSSWARRIWEKDFSSAIRNDSLLEDVTRNTQACNDRVRDVSVEFTQLFVGPPKPAAAPWETFYREEGVTSGFGRATLEMREALRASGLKISNENNQYDDHIGIELLYIAELCSSNVVLSKEQRDFIKKHPCAWIDSFHSLIKKSRPHGYFDFTTGLTKALLISLLEECDQNKAQSMK